MLAKVAGVIETAGLQIGASRPDFGNGSLGQNFGRDIIDRRISDFMDEADIVVLAGRNAGDNFPPRDFRIDNGLAPAPPVVDHHNEILHGGAFFASACADAGSQDAVSISENQKLVKP
jgi:hypothetical protein